MTTHTISVTSLVGFDIEGMRANVRSSSSTPAWRTLIKAEYKRIKGETWLYLWWEPVPGRPAPDMECIDCGYSGKGLDLVNDWGWEIEIDEDSCDDLQKSLLR